MFSSTFKHPAAGEFSKIKQLISLDPYPNNDFQNQSSFFSNLLNDNGDDEFPDPVTEPEERFFTRQQPPEQKRNETDMRNFLPYTQSSTVMKQEVEKKDVPISSLAMVNCSRRVPSLSPADGNGSYGYTNRSNLDSASSFRAVNSTNSNLVRQNSTPAGFLSSENGFASMKKGSYSSTLNNHTSFSSGPSSSASRFLPQITENKNELHDSKFSGLKRSRDSVVKMPQPQNGDTGNHTPNLVHHMSLPKTSSEMAAVANFLQFQQEPMVPWRTRAKRGFATHPRSIAERVRRTRISERIKRLQDLFPDIDKQSNTADMLDMAVEYIKNLQKELQTLNDARARCQCSSKQL